MPDNDFVDYYELLQLSPNAMSETVEKVYRILAKRYHPDNQDTGDTDTFTRLREAYNILRDPEKRAAYDVNYENVRGHQWKIFDQKSAAGSFEGDRRIFQGILSLLYVARRQDISNPGLGIVRLEKLLGCPEEHLEFHIWYLREKGWIERLESGKWAISVEGVDRIVAGDLMLPKDRLLDEGRPGSRSGAARREPFARLETEGSSEAEEPVQERVG